MDKIFATIKGGRVDNIIVASQAFIDAHAAELGAEQYVDITDAAPRPGPKWTYDGAKFSPPADK